MSKSVRSSAAPNVRASAASNVRDPTVSNVRDSAASNVRSMAASNIRGSAASNVRDSLASNAKSLPASTIRSSVVTNPIRETVATNVRESMATTVKSLGPTSIRGSTASNARSHSKPGGRSSAEPTEKRHSPPLHIRSPNCAHCGEQITDVVVQAMDTTWHQDHFLCAHCQKPISSQRYHVYDGKSYCEADYALLFLKKCSQCKLPIRDVVVMALGRPWHKEHFTCAGCSTVLSHKGFYEKEGQPYCLECFESKFCPNCLSCNKPIVDQAVLALGEKYHVKCFRCNRCDLAIMDGTFRIINSNPVCENCFDK